MKTRSVLMSSAGALVATLTFTLLPVQVNAFQGTAAASPWAISAALAEASRIEPRAPFGGCYRIEWERRSASTIRIYAFSDDLASYLGWGNYGLLWITIHDRNSKLKYSGTHNVSTYRQFDQNFSAVAGDRVTTTLTNDNNTQTLCSGGAWV